jgi:hypothetical protein
VWVDGVRAKRVTTSWVIVTFGEAEGSGVKSAHLRARCQEAFLHADIALDIEDQVKQAQEALKMEGFHPGPVDGVVGRRTREALRAYRTREGLPPSGRLG